MEIKNETTQRQCCNALLHYFYLPVVCGALTRYDSEQVYISEQYQISANTALFVLNKTIEMVHFHPLINSIFMALFVGQGPQRIINQKFQCQYGQLAETLMRGSANIPSHNSQVSQTSLNSGMSMTGRRVAQGHTATFSLIQAPPTFTAKWKYKFPTQFKQVDLGYFLTEYFNNSCAQIFLEDPRYERCTGLAVAQM